MRLSVSPNLQLDFLFGWLFPFCTFILTFHDSSGSCPQLVAIIQYLAFTVVIGKRLHPIPVVLGFPELGRSLGINSRRA